mmetsp:Transcript_98304/g.233962  ORF Transcript_98304/g.233962 Transcript_98304/m.233962 type:complete len:164 (-) Transcript_98304:32-523(-)
MDGVSSPRWESAKWSPTCLGLKRTIFVISCTQAAVALLRFAFADFWGALVDVFLSIIGFIAVMEMKSVYLLYFGFACSVGCCLSLGTLLLQLIHDGPDKQLCPALISSSAASLLGAIVGLAAWGDMRASDELDLGAARAVAYGSLKDEGHLDPFLLQEDGKAR